ncbi:MAG: thioredoxin [Candidatus Peregrinibacteria bacterium]|nr:thioredoxin [Candidatus Peregrinibacteria bacterium]
MAQQVTVANFDEEVLKSSDIVLVDFWAPWCGPCQMLLPIIEELSEDLGDGAKVCKVNVDEAPELASKYGVMSIPSLKLFKGGKIVDEAVGVKSKDELMAMINNHR